MRSNWTPLVRAAIPQCPTPFSVYDVCRAMGKYITNDGSRHSIKDALDRLAAAGELDKTTKKRGEKRSCSIYSATPAFCAEEFDFEAQQRGAKFLQHLCLQWGNRSHAAAD